VARLNFQPLLAAGYVSVRKNKEEPRLVSSDEWFLGKYSPFSCKIFPRDIFIAFYGNFRPCFPHISLRNISPRNLSFGNNYKMSRNEALQSCFQKKYYWLPAVNIDSLNLRAVLTLYLSKPRSSTPPCYRLAGPTDDSSLLI
jgi:hypothetical protein